MIYYFIGCITVLVSLVYHWVEESGERERIIDEKIRRGIK